MSGVGDRIIKLIDQNNLQELNESKYIEKKVNTSDIYHFYMMYRNVDIKVLKSSLYYNKLDNLYSIVSSFPWSFKTSVYTSKLSREQLQDIIINYMINKKPQYYRNTILEWYVRSKDTKIVDVLNKTSTTKDIVWACIAVMGERISIQRKLDLTRAGDNTLVSSVRVSIPKDTLRRYREEYKVALDLLVNTVKELPEDTVDDVLEIYYLADEFLQYKHTHEELSLLLNEKYDLVPSQHDYLSSGIIISDDLELFKKYLQIYIEDIKTIEDNEYDNSDGYMLIYNSIVIHSVDKSSLKQFKHIFSEYYPLPEDTQEYKNRVINYITESYKYIPTVLSYSEFRSMGHHIT